MCIRSVADNVLIYFSISWERSCYWLQNKALNKGNSCYLYWLMFCCVGWLNEDVVTWQNSFFSDVNDFFSGTFFFIFFYGSIRLLFNLLSWELRALFIFNLKLSLVRLAPVSIHYLQKVRFIPFWCFSFLLGYMTSHFAVGQESYLELSIP